MQLSNRHPVLSILLLLCVAKACHAELKCYVCEDCPKITRETPLQNCDESFFSAGGSTAASTLTTTETTETETTESDEGTTTPDIDDNSKETDEPDEGGSTMRTPPTPATAGPASTTTAMPTPPNPGTAIVPGSLNASSVEITVDMEEVEVSTEMDSSSEVIVRQRRQAMNTDVTYHCYRTQRKNENGTAVIDRGCSRVTTMQSVCGQLALESNDTKSGNCFACTISRCNGSSAIGISILAVVVGVLASLLSRN